jgi:hypothetical protein
MEAIDVFYGHLAYFVVIWYVFPFWYIVHTKKNLATLLLRPVLKTKRWNLQSLSCSDPGS